MTGGFCMVGVLFHNLCVIFTDFTWLAETMK